MKTVELGRTGEHVSQLALGCMGTFTDESTSMDMLDRYVEAGGTFLDTANCYAWWHRRGSLGGESEALLGRWFARSGRRDEVFLATKGSALVRGPAHRMVERSHLAAGAHPAAVRAARLARAGRSTAAALLPSPKARFGERFDRGRRAARLPARAR